MVLTITAVALAPAALSPIVMVPGAAISSPFPLTASVSLGTYLGNHTANPFFAVLYAVTGISATSHLQQGAFFNSTPMTWFRLYGGGDSYDPTTQTNYVAPAGGGTYTPVSGSLVNLTAFKSWCASRTPTCSWLTYLPAEENDTRAALHYANWYHKVLGLAPTRWEFGNEPTAWTHYGKNITTWSTFDNSTPTGLDYATMVRSYVSAVRAAYPSDQFVGIENACACNNTLVTETAVLDSKRVATMAYHEFPWGSGLPTVTANYFGALRSSTNITSTAAHFRSILSTACSTCSDIPVQIGAYQAGPSGNLSALSTQYPGAVFLAASVIQALEANVTTLTLFNSGYMYNLSTGAPQPQGLLAQRMLSNLTMGNAYDLTLSHTSVAGVFGVVTRSMLQTSVFIVNTNTTRSIAFSLPTSVYTPGPVNSYWFWSPHLTQPTAHRSVALPTSFMLPPESILLISDF